MELIKPYDPLFYSFFALDFYLRLEDQCPWSRDRRDVN